MKITDIAGILKETPLKTELTSRIKIYHDLVSQALTGTPAEGLLVNALKAVGINTEWSAMSHCQEKDIVMVLNNVKVNVSQKGCKESKNRISVSSYRTTSAKTLEEKLDLIENLDRDLHTMMVFSRFHSGKNVFPDYYKIYLINPHLLNPKKFSWKQTVDSTGKHNGFRTCLNEWNINMGIRNSMSDQVWIDIGKDSLEKYPDMILELFEIVA